MKKYSLNSILIIVLLFSCLIFPNLVNASYSWSTVGAGVTKSVLSDATGNDVLIVYGGYTVKQTNSEKWAEALVNTTLKSKGVKTIYAVAGPNEASYVNKEIENTKLVADLVKAENFKKDVSRIFVIAHSSGVFPAIEFLNSKNLKVSTIGKSITLFNVDGDVGMNSAGASVVSARYSVIGHDANNNKSYYYNNATAIKKDITTITTGCFGTTANQLTYCIHMRLINKEAYGQLLASGFTDSVYINADYNNTTDANVENTYLEDITVAAPVIASAPTLVASDPTTATITLSATGLTANETYMFKATGIDGTSLDEIVTADTSGNASTTLLGLSAGSNYTGSVLKYNLSDSTTSSSGISSISFETLGEFVTIPATVENTTTPATTVNNTSTLLSTKGDLIPCGTTANPNDCNEIDATTGVSLGWNNLMTLINNVVNFILFRLVVPIAAIMFVYAGFELLTSGGSSEKATKAKKIFTNVALGLILAAAAWLIINTILTTLGYDGSWIGFGKVL